MAWLWYWTPACWWQQPSFQAGCSRFAWWRQHAACRMPCALPTLVPLSAPRTWLAPSPTLVPHLGESAWFTSERVAAVPSWTTWSGPKWALTRGSWACSSGSGAFISWEVSSESTWSRGTCSGGHKFTASKNEAGKVSRRVWVAANVFGAFGNSTVRLRRTSSRDPLSVPCCFQPPSPAVWVFSTWHVVRFSRSTRWEDGKMGLEDCSLQLKRTRLVVIGWKNNMLSWAQKGTRQNRL